MRRTAGPLFRSLAVVIVLVVLARALMAPSAAAQGVTVTTNAATSNFPDGIELKLEADSAEPITHIELLYQTADLETLNLAVPDFQPGTHVEITHLLDFRLNYQPSGVDITYRWRFTDDQGVVTETAPTSLLWSDNRFDWQTVSSDNVTVYAYNQNEAFNKIILDSAQSTVDRLSKEFGVQQTAPIRIWVYNSQRDFEATQQGNSSHWVAGTAYPQLHVILAILPEGNKREVGRVIPHEISHQLLNQATKNPFNAPPTWLDEGLAVFNQDNGNEDFPAMVENAAEKGHLFSIRALNSSFPYDAADAALAYAESYSVVRFILDRYGEAGLAAVIRAYPQGVSHDDALRMGIGVDIDELDRLWKESLNYPGDTPRGAGSTQPVSGTGSAGNDDFPIGLGLAAAAVICALLLGLVATRRSTRTAIRAN